MPKQHVALIIHAELNWVRQRGCIVEWVCVCPALVLYVSVIYIREEHNVPLPVMLMLMSSCWDSFGHSTVWEFTMFWNPQAKWDPPTFLILLGILEIGVLSCQRQTGDDSVNVGTHSWTLDNNTWHSSQISQAYVFPLLCHADNGFAHSAVHQSPDIVIRSQVDFGMILTWCLKCVNPTGLLLLNDFLSKSICLVCKCYYIVTKGS